MLKLAVVILTAFVAFTARAAAPPGTDPNSPEARWFRAQTIPGGPGKGQICCDRADGRYVDARIVGDHWEAFISKKEFNGAPDAWLPVPNDAILAAASASPTGEAVVWWFLGRIRCFAPPAET